MATERRWGTVARALDKDMETSSPPLAPRVGYKMGAFVSVFSYSQSHCHQMGGRLSSRSSAGWGILPAPHSPVAAYSSFGSQHLAQHLAHRTAVQRWPPSYPMREGRPPKKV